jgi:hypothetical protein
LAEVIYLLILSTSAIVIPIATPNDFCPSEHAGSPWGDKKTLKGIDIIFPIFVPPYEKQ